MAKKAELEAEYDRYRAACAAAARAEAAGDLRAAVAAAEGSLPLVHPAVTFRRRFLKAEPTAPTLDLLLRYAPPLFLRTALDAADAWYATGTRTERAALPDVPERLAGARARLDRAVELWAALAADPGARLVPDPVCPGAAETVRTWLVLGALTSDPRAGTPAYARTSDPRRPAHGKCSGCGRVLAAPLARLLDPLECPGCRAPRTFVVVRRPA